MVVRSDMRAGGFQVDLDGRDLEGAPGGNRPAGRPAGSHRSRRQRGFTLVELIVVIGIIGILVGIAMPAYRTAVVKAREAVLKEDLWIMRDCIDQYFTDKGHYPSDLNALVDELYIKKVPVDPFTNAADTWVTEEAESSETSDPDAPAGIRDVKSGAEGTTIDGVPYSEL